MLVDAFPNLNLNLGYLFGDEEYPARIQATPSSPLASTPRESGDDSSESPTAIR